MNFHIKMKYYLQNPYCWTFVYISNRTWRILGDFKYVTPEYHPDYICKCQFVTKLLIKKTPKLFYYWYSLHFWRHHAFNLSVAPLISPSEKLINQSRHPTHILRSSQVIFFRNLSFYFYTHLHFYIFLVYVFFSK